MLHTQQSCKGESAKEKTTFLGEDDGEDKDSVHGSIVLEMDMIDD